MKKCHYWLLAVLSVLTLMTIATAAVAEEKSVSGHVEIGVSGMDTNDNPARVNEYVNTRSEESFSFAPKLFLESQEGNSAFALEIDVMGPRDQRHSLDVDANRIFRLGIDYQVMEHWKDHETLDQMGATARDDVGGSQPSVTTDKTFSDLAALPTPVTAVGGGTLNYDAGEAYRQELANDYIVTRRELKSEADITLPSLPNITFHAGVRLETREGLEQAISVTKCDNCHVSATGKDIDERTEEIGFGATGKFGPVTVDYDYLARTFSEGGATPVRFFEDAGNPTAYNLLYEAGDYAFARTPDSEKDSHSLKARVDLARDTNIIASYVKSDVESSKSQTQTEYELLGGSTLSSDYESFGGKLATRLTDNLRVSLRANAYEIDVDSTSIYFPGRERIADGGLVPNGNILPFDTIDERHSAEARKVQELAIDLVYRLARGTTLRLGYEFEEVERDQEELGETKTHTLKTALKSRINRAFSGNISYTYQDIDEPLAGAHVGIAQGDPMAIQDPLGSGLWYYNTSDFTTAPDVPKVWYWNDVYPNRQLASTNLADEVHEAKLSTTWSPSTNMAATLFARVRIEENDDVSYEQQTYVPGVSLYYAPNGKLNLTMAYTFNKQETENQMCVGWYHG
ncbi:MAG: MtrB/PioB family outer membrane beta-barrel protein [Desulfuromonadales bacterium]|nr:MtrB/PioB family outer membrane beta-barrel protein [Desulfuromonadales bacterium]